jgi:serine/threonine-protein kinase
VQHLGRYQLLDELGRGAMGVVYKGHDPTIDRPVALKVLTPGQGLEGPERAQYRKRFLREARAAGRLTHPNIVTVYDVGEDQDRAFLVMEYIEGEPLDRLLRRVGALPLPRVLEIADQVAGALDYAHAHGIVHRDVKPANILVSSSGLVKVTDFGIARLADADLTLTQHTQGTPSYMAPEQVAGHPVDGRADLFALGALLYELLTGARAFPGERLTTIIYRIVHEEPPPLCKVAPGLPPGIGPCLQRALAKDPARRYARAAELARDLRQTAAAAPKEGGVRPAPVFQTPTAPTLRLPVGRGGPRRRWLIAGGAALAAVVVFVGILGRASHRAGAPRASAPAPLAVREEPARKADVPGEATRHLPEWKRRPDPEAQRQAAPGPPPHERDGAPMVHVPGGTFLMGDTHGDGDPNERPVHRVSVAAFRMDRTEVTVVQFARFLQTAQQTKALPGGVWPVNGAKRTHPAVNVPWRAAAVYCRWAGKRLPTEAEWEFAARGLDGRRYPWGNAWDGARARSAENSHGGGPVDVGSYPAGASPFGVLDMAGNVWEWVGSPYGIYPSQPPGGREPSGPAKPQVIRGGSWFQTPWDLRTTKRDFADPGHRSPYIGFRCAADW